MQKSKCFISLFLVAIFSMFVDTAYYMVIPKISNIIAVEYKNANIFFQEFNNRDFIYIINPLIISISTFILWIFMFNKISSFSKTNVNMLILFSSIYSLVILPIFLFHFACLKLSFLVIFGWFIKFYLEVFFAGLFFLLFKVK